MVACRHFLFLLSFVSLSFVPSAHAAEWTQHRYPADGFQVEFSGQISVAETELSAEARKKVVRSSQYLQDGGAYAYIVTAGLYVNGPNFEAGVKAGNSSGECKTLSEKTISISGATQAVEFVGTGCKNGRRETRYIVKGNWFYHILAIFPDDGDAEAARYFLNSFKLISN